MTPGHVFVVKGTIGKLVADVAVVSTDAGFHVEPYWHEIVTPNQAFVAKEHQPAEWSARGWGRDPLAEQIWFLDVTAAHTGGGDAFDRLRCILADVTRVGLTSRVEGRPLPLVVLPVIGTKGGGFSHQRGSVVERLPQLCREFVTEHPIDVAIVAQNAASFAALQHRRRSDAALFFPGVPLDEASHIGQSASEGSLALFIGAGTSVPAGAPSWDGLLKVLSDEAELSDDVRRGFSQLSALDQAELLHARLGKGLGITIRDQVSGLQPALSHVLLASLNCQGAVTTNYDRLYEDAVAGSGGTAATVLPNEVPRAGSRWLLKMHGDMANADSIVLTRGQFVEFTGVSGPAGAVLQALLLTKHLLVVGTSMKDDNFLRLIYEVAAYRRRVTAKADKGANASPHDSYKFGTILTLEEDPARQELHAPYFHWQAMPGRDVSDSARQLEIFLDAVAMFASNDNSWLLDKRFSYLHDDRQQRLAERARVLAQDIRQDLDPASAWDALARDLDRFGANSMERAR